MMMMTGNSNPNPILHRGGISCFSYQWWIKEVHVYYRANTLLNSLTYIIPGAVAPVTLCLLQRQNLEGSERGGAWLCGDHPSETGYCPRPNVVVIRTH